MRLRRDDREILALAVPAFLALVAEPLFLLADAAIIGHLGTAPLAALGVAGAVITTVVGLCVFLAYGTTADVARRLGAGDRAGAMTSGMDGIWLAVVIGLPVTFGGALTAGFWVDLFGASNAVSEPATDYLRVAFLGTTPLLLVLAATGVLRGLQDTRTPLVAAVAGNLANIVLNLALVNGLGPIRGYGLVGSAWGTVLAQTLMALGLLAVVARAAQAAGVSLRPRFGGVRAAGRAGVPLLIRTLTLRAALLVTTYAVVDLNDETTLAAHQLAFTIWTFLVFALDAIAIAAQALTGRSLGASDVAGTRAITDRMVRWGWWSGTVCGVVLLALSPVLGHLFTNDQAVVDALTAALVVAALGQPVAGVVFVLDGVLIGAGDGRYLAWGGLAVFIVYAPLALLGGSLIWIWVAFSGAFIGGRLVVLLHRARGDRWMITGDRT